ncbi:MAG: recombinase zinc beta ribbon domain-containing protein, partial [Lachnospiraceae bacterium]|nr:recombinase zinc beta ribbon domain-containing protein [Lachnospiraceae bacterium]
HIPVPAYHQAQLGVGLWQNREIKNPYKWGSSTIAHILQKHEYLGHTVNFKTRKHFKDKKSHYVGKDQWLIFEDTHEPITDQETFDNVHRIRGQVRRYPDDWGEAHPLTGLMYCADCGGKMYVHRVNNRKRVPMYICGNYAKQPVGILCRSAHRIKADHVMEIVAKTIKEVVQYANLDKGRFAEEIQSHIEDRQTVDFTEQKKRMSICEKRIGELEMLIAKIYEDNALGKLSDKRYTMLYNQYEGEQEQLQDEVNRYKAEQTQYEYDRKSTARFLRLVERYSNAEEMSTVMLNEFVEKIIVHERDRKGSADTNYEPTINIPKCAGVERLCEGANIQIPFNADEINLIYQFGEQSKAETCANLSTILSQIKGSDTKQIVSTTLKKLNALSEESCTELTVTTKRRKLTERDHSIKARLAKAKEQSRQPTVAEGKKHRTHSKGKGGMAL